MADPLENDHLSVVPYDNNREVVLASRHADSIVVFDPTSRQLILRNRNRDIDQTATDSICPQCRRPFEDNSAVEDDFADEQQPSFINNGYFRMLANSLPSSRSTSRPPSPRKQLAKAVRSPLGQDTGLPDAEFVGSAPAPPDANHGISESAFAPNYFQRFFKVEKELGRGGRGVVLLVRHILDKVSLGSFACKRVPVGDDHAWLEKVLVEVQALQSLSHQNLVSYRHVWLEDYQINSFSPSVPCAFILQQYCNGGDLHTYVCAPAQVRTTTQELKERIRRRSKGESEMPRKLNEARKLEFEQIYSFFLDITEGLRFLHLNGFIHRDLKPSNCLLHSVGGETRVLVSDFGEVQYENSIRKSTGSTGTISYCAPEVLQPVSPGGPLGNFTFKSDIFSLGMILHFLCFANLPYYSANVLQEEAEDLDELREEIIGWAGFDERQRGRPDLPHQLYGVLKRLLAIVPEIRPTSDEVLSIVKQGNSEFKPELKRRTSGAGTEELTPGKRIVPIDSPGTGNTSKSLPRPREVDALSPTRQMRRRNGPTSLSEDHRRPSMADEPTSPIHSAVAMRRSSSNGVIGPPRLQARPYAHVSSASNSPPPDSDKHLDPASDHHQQLLLPSPENLSIQQRAVQILRFRPTNINVYIVLFVVKIVSLIQPCLSTGFHPGTFYNTFIVAAVELLTCPHPTWRLMILLLVHTFILWYANRNGQWCQTYWTLQS